MTSSKEDADAVLQIIKTICEETPDYKRARWDEIVSACKLQGIDEDRTHEGIESLMNAGLIYEPTLGVLKLVA